MFMAFVGCKLYFGRSFHQCGFECACTECIEATFQDSLACKTHIQRRQAAFYIFISIFLSKIARRFFTGYSIYVQDTPTVLLLQSRTKAVYASPVRPFTPLLYYVALRLRLRPYLHPHDRDLVHRDPYRLFRVVEAERQEGPVQGHLYEAFPQVQEQSQVQYSRLRYWHHLHLHRLHLLVNDSYLRGGFSQERSPTRVWVTRLTGSQGLQLGEGSL